MKSVKKFSKQASRLSLTCHLSVLPVPIRLRESLEDQSRRLGITMTELRRRLLSLGLAQLEKTETAILISGGIPAVDPLSGKPIGGTDVK